MVWARLRLDPDPVPPTKTGIITGTSSPPPYHLLRPDSQYKETLCVISAYLGRDTRQQARQKDQTKRVDHDQRSAWTTTKAAYGPRPRARVNHDQQRVWNRTSEGSVESRTELERLTANVAIVITKRRDRYQERVDAARQRCQERGRCQEQVDAARSESSLPREADDDSPEHRGRRSDRQARQRQRKGNPTSKLQDRDGA